jgi:non-specific serine/threonine protein kinase
VAGVLDHLGEVATEEGDYVTAPRLFEQSLALWRQLGQTRGIADVLMQLGWMSLRSGAYEQAVARLEESLALFRSIDDTILMGFGLAGLGEAALRQGQYERARPLLEESLALRRHYNDKWGMGTSLGSLGWLALRQGDYARMRAAMAESLSLRLDTGDKGGLAWCLEKLAEAATLEAPRSPADLARAARLYGAAAALRAPVRSVIDPADQPEHERHLARLRAALGDAAFDAAWAEGARLPLAEAVEQALAEPVAPQPAAATPADKARLGGLTPRECEVAALLAQGKSNREIAAALVVGTRTAETYISRILNKLGFSSRVQIATWAIEQGLAPPKQ